MRNKFLLVTATILIIALNSIAQKKGSFKDPRDGKKYKTVVLGPQTWMAENLNFKTDSNSWCYNDSNINCVKYGRLYTWEEAMKVCPTGWHLPSAEEWNIHFKYKKGHLDSICRSPSSKSLKYNWKGRIIGLTNTSSFNALRGGNRSEFGIYNNKGLSGFWWTSTESGDITAKFKCMRISQWDGYYKESGYSVRCVKNDDIHPGNNYVKDSTITKVSNKIHRIKSAFLEPIIDTRDSNIYKTIKIGTQIWMAENSRYKIDSIDNDTSYFNSWCYDNDPNNCLKFGRLYTYDAAKIACPSGWHLPSETEWTTLIKFPGGNEAIRLEYYKDTYNFPEMNATGFTGLLSGMCYYDGVFSSMDYESYWWCSDFGYYLKLAKLRRDGDLQIREYYQFYGASVRCIKD